ncbi:MAG: TraB/GumN family protein [Rhizobiaceae bacterium]|nr:TraB/GumN family protein [Rhizobiaceae bacterium]
MAIRISETVLIAIGLIKIALIGAFLASLSSASATFAANEPTTTNQMTCGGINLVEKMRSEEPKKYSELVSDAAKITNGSSIFWKIEKDGAEPSYLLGTMHVSDPKVTTLSPAAQTALNSSKTIIVENTETFDPKKATAAMVQLKHLTFLKAGQTLDAKFNGELKTKLQQAVTKRGMPFQIANRMQPWVVATIVALPVCEMVAKQRGKKVLDHLIADHAIKNGKTLIGLETMEEQFSAIASLPAEFHFSALKETLAMGSDQSENIIATMKALYQTGSISMLMPLMKSVSPKAFTGKGTTAFQEALIINRNRIMAERSQEHLEKGGTFLAVGALHLSGETGLVSLLRKQGFKVTAIKSAG